jgi:hypothetical protein
MASPNHHQAELNSSQLDELILGVYAVLTYQQPPSPDNTLAQAIFSEIATIASDPASDDSTVLKSSHYAQMLHPWIVREGKPKRYAHALSDIPK